MPKPWTMKDDFFPPLLACPTLINTFFFSSVFVLMVINQNKLLFQFRSWVDEFGCIGLQFCELPFIIEHCFECNSIGHLQVSLRNERENKLAHKNDLLNVYDHSSRCLSRHFHAIKFSLIESLTFPRCRENPISLSSFLRTSEMVWTKGKPRTIKTYV